VNVALGIWLMAAPAVLGYGGIARSNDRVVGPLAAGFAYVALWSVTRSVRWANVPLGLWLLVAPWLLQYEWVPLLHATVVGVLLISFAWRGGKTSQRFGGGWSALLSKEGPG
jgi:hypothetical protein